jgi:type II secretory pathway component GspD/PulD (secretin)
VDPVISHDKKYVTLDVKPTLATLINGIISTIKISLGSFTNVAFQVPIGVPEIALQQAFTSVTVPNGGTVLLGGFKSLNEAKFTSFFPILGQIPILENLFRRRATLQEERSLVILLSVRIVDLRGEEDRKFNRE